MTDGAALSRARLAVALRALPADLPVARGELAAAARVPADVRDLAAQLERVSPGLSLMMRLRARLFDGAAAWARRRRFAQVVTVGRGLQRPRRGRGLLPTVAVEHPAVVAACQRSASGVYLAASDLEEGAWRVLRRSIFSPSRRRTLFLVEGMSLWGGDHALEFWLEVFSRRGAAGSEMLLNVLDEHGAARAQSAAHAVGTRSAPTPLRIGFGIADGELAARVVRAGLDVVGVFDSHTVQSAYLGVADLLIRESYAWVKVPGNGAATPVPPLRLLLGPPAHARRTSTCGSDRPLLRSDVSVEPATQGVALLRIAVTALRSCDLAVSPRQLAVASLFDGRHSIAEIDARFRTIGQAGIAREAIVLAERLGARGFLATDLATLREAAFVALEKSERRLPPPVERMLGTARGNAALDHLRAVLRSGGDVRVVRDGHVAVIARPSSTVAEVRNILIVAKDTLAAISELLNVRFSGYVVVDVATSRAGVPVTMVADAEPYTLVRIPLPNYSRSMLAHELTHVLAMSGSRWLSEGLAVWVQRRIAPGACFPDDAADDNRRRARHLAAASLANAPLGGKPTTRAAYRSAAAFVEWVVEQCGFSAFAHLFRAFRADGAGSVAACRGSAGGGADERQ